ncbi:hypothetical protein GC105_11980 [Alkalibaculum sp. M08DMB]|uniref:Uncharacterized protein n=1 Tax=Alkalibaculum sporogenes TaxID=2655001 RepID=A0A6A7KAI0_9FIRM|nr:hypothetical protein [Alkalibaculum sporogenes]MPW26510.1 hypothetical protein [Alkalibaculum sporogenes]
MRLDDPGGIDMILIGANIINIFIILFFLSISIYAFIIFVKLSRRGIKVLDIYIEKNKNNNKP